MDRLIRLVTELKLDIKRVSQAMSLEGATAIVKKHNQNKPEDSHW